MFAAFSKKKLFIPAIKPSATLLPCFHPNHYSLLAITLQENEHKHVLKRCLISTVFEVITPLQLSVLAVRWRQRYRKIPLRSTPIFFCFYPLAAYRVLLLEQSFRYERRRASFSHFDPLFVVVSDRDVSRVALLP